MKRILLVEDSLYTTKALMIVLGSKGFKIDHLGNGKGAYQKAKTGAYDLIILDLMMPEVDGKQVYAQLRADEETRKIPVLILTARADLAMWDEDLKGCNIMNKPFDNDKLVAEVKRLMSR